MYKEPIRRVAFALFIGRLWAFVLARPIARDVDKLAS